MIDLVSVSDSPYKEVGIPSDKQVLGIVLSTNLHPQRLQLR